MIQKRGYHVLMHSNILISSELITIRFTSTNYTTQIKRESPLPKHPDLFSSFPSVAAGEQRIDYNRSRSPTAPRAHNSQGKVAGYDFV